MSPSFRPSLLARMATLVCLSALILPALAQPASAPTAFPGAQGWAADTAGGRGGRQVALLEALEQQRRDGVVGHGAAPWDRSSRRARRVRRRLRTPETDSPTASATSS